jgi:hypothetical protein
MSKIIKNTIDFLEAFDYAINTSNSNPITQLALEFMFIILAFLLMPIWVTNILIPVRKKWGLRK